MTDLLAYLPEHLKSSPEIVEYQRAMQKWTDRLHGDKDDMLDQFILSKATWGLRLWEIALGIETDISKPYPYRRSRIESKLRGLGTTTMAMIKNVAESFSNGSVDVVEHNGQYSFDVVFTGTVGIPPNMDDLAAAIEEIKPAHLAYSFVIIYRVWDMVSYLTWDEAGAYTWDQLKEGAM